VIDVLQFFTRFPIRHNPGFTPERFQRNLWFLPLLGLVVGGIQMLAFNLVGPYLPLRMTVLIMLILEQVITGGLHLDGLADTADGLFSGRRGDQALAIMKTGGIGPLGAFTLFAVVFLQVEGIAALAGGGVWLVLGVLSRTAVLALGYRGRGIEGGLGELITGKVSTANLLAGTALSYGTLCFFLGPVASLWVLLGLVPFIRGYRWLSGSLLGGLSGDQYGFVLEGVKVLTLLFLLIGRGLGGL